MKGSIEVASERSRRDYRFYSYYLSEVHLGFLVLFGFLCR